MQKKIASKKWLYDILGMRENWEQNMATRHPGDEKETILGQLCYFSGVSFI